MQANNFEDTEAIARSVASNPVFDLNGDLLDPSFTLYKVFKPYQDHLSHLIFL